MAKQTKEDIELQDFRKQITKGLEKLYIKARGNDILEHDLAYILIAFGSSQAYLHLKLADTHTFIQNAVNAGIGAGRDTKEFRESLKGNDS